MIDGIQKKLVVYTAIVGPTDSYAPPRRAGIDAVLFSDGVPSDVPESQASVRIVSVHPSFSGPRRTARQIKILGHPLIEYGGHDYAIWLDGSMDPGDTDLVAFAEEALADKDLAVLLHPDRRDLYAEAEAVCDLRLDDVGTVQRQVERYRNEGFPSAEFPLPQTGVIVWRMRAAIERFRAVWWREVAFGSVRDQVSFGYAAWRSGLRSINYLEGPHERWGIKYRRHVTR